MAFHQTIQRGELIKLLSALDLGAPVAEHDVRLFEARIETSAFSDLYRDRVDLIAGTKGSGKTALYRLMAEYLRGLMLKSRVVILTGVESSGDPVFVTFKEQFDSLTEIEFENFWRVYFIALILERFVKSGDYTELLEDAKSEVEEFKTRCRRAKIPELNHSRTFRDIVQSVLRCIKVRIGILEAEEDATSYSLIQIEPAEPDKGTQIEAVTNGQVPVFLSDIHEAIVAVLKKANLKLWIMLDRLDEVFPRRTKLERVALRSLLRTTRNFPTDIIRLKLFLRDDIFENILRDEEGFTALSHIEARRAPTLKWGPYEIQLLIVKRFCGTQKVRAALRAEKLLIEQNDPDHAKDVFSRIFPAQVVPGKNQSNTLDWIYHHCADGRGVVTPRDVIDLLEFAIKSQVEHLRRGASFMDCFIGPVALKEGLKELSQKKCRTYLEAEFPEFWPDIKKFENSKAEHNEISLKRLMGAEWNRKVEDLVSLGFLQNRPLSKTVIVPFLFRAGMGIRQGKSS
jgi:hypothetical protein